VNEIDERRYEVEWSSYERYWSFVVRTSNNESMTKNSQRELSIHVHVIDKKWTAIATFLSLFRPMTCTKTDWSAIFVWAHKKCSTLYCVTCEMNERRRVNENNSSSLTKTNTFRAIHSSFLLSLRTNSLFLSPSTRCSRALLSNNERTTNEWVKKCHEITNYIYSTFSRMYLVGKQSMEGLMRVRGLLTTQYNVFSLSLSPFLFSSPFDSLLVSFFSLA